MRLRDRLIRMHRNDPFDLNWFEINPTDTPVLVYSKHIASTEDYALLGVSAILTVLIVIAIGIY